MSTTYRPLKRILFAQLFDGCLEPFDIREHVHRGSTTKSARCLTDYKSFLWVYRSDDGAVRCFKRWRPNGMPIEIIKTIAKVFKTKIVSEYEPQFWGFDTQAEWDAALEAEAKERDKWLYLDILKYVSNKPNDIKRGTNRETLAKIAKQLIAADPGLLKLKNRDKLMNKIEKYSAGIKPDKTRPQRRRRAS